MSSEARYTEIGTRPWGKYYVLEDESKFKVKRIVVNPGQRLSLQSHEHRAEHWVVVQGRGLLEVRDTDNQREWVKEYSAGEYCYVPAGCKHRMSNPFSEVMVLIEVQNGDYTGEDDIVRYEDDYGRAKID